MRRKGVIKNLTVNGKDRGENDIRIHQIAGLPTDFLNQRTNAGHFFPTGEEMPAFSICPYAGVCACQLSGG